VLLPPRLPNNTFLEDTARIRLKMVAASASVGAALSLCVQIVSVLKIDIINVLVALFYLLAATLLLAIRLDLVSWHPPNARSPWDYLRGKVGMVSSRLMFALLCYSICTVGIFVYLEGFVSQTRGGYTIYRSGDRAGVVSFAEPAVRAGHARQTWAFSAVFLSYFVPVAMVAIVRLRSTSMRN
jgi:hypothetical protein